MKQLFILLLLANVLYFEWELDRQTKFDISLKSPITELPNQAIALKFLAELEEKPEFRISKPENFKNTVIDSNDEASSEFELEDYDVQADDNLSADLNTQLPNLSAIEERGTPESGSCFSFGPVADESQATMRHKDEQS